MKPADWASHATGKEYFLYIFGTIPKLSCREWYECLNHADVSHLLKKTHSVSFQIERLSNVSLIGMVVLIVALDILIILLWQFVDPLAVKMHSMPKEVGTSYQ